MHFVERANVKQFVSFFIVLYTNTLYFQGG